jgi:hypothetical protein
VGEGRGPDFDEAFGVARAIEREDGPAIANPAVRAAGRLVRAQPGAPQLRNCSALSHGASFAPDLMDMGDVIRDAGLAPMRAAFQEALLNSPGRRIGGGSDEILKDIIAERVLGLSSDVRVDKATAFRACRRSGNLSAREGSGGGLHLDLTGVVGGRPRRSRTVGREDIGAAPRVASLGVRREPGSFLETHGPPYDAVGYTDGPRQMLS